MVQTQADKALGAPRTIEVPGIPLAPQARTFQSIPESYVDDVHEAGYDSDGYGVCSSCVTISFTDAMMQSF